MRFCFAKRCLKTLVCVLVVGACVGSARATVVDFESATTGGCQVTLGGSVAGFSLSPHNGGVGGGFNKATSLTCSSFAPTANSGLQYMTQFNSGVGEFSKDDGTFTLESLYVHADARKGPSKVRFQGLDGIDGTVLYTLDAVIRATWQQIVFLSWKDMKTLRWDSISPDVSNISIDDFVYSAAKHSAAARPDAAVPVPATLALLGTGFAFIGIGRRQRKTPADAGDVSRPGAERHGHGPAAVRSRA